MVKLIGYLIGNSIVNAIVSLIVTAVIWFILVVLFDGSMDFLDSWKWSFIICWAYDIFKAFIKLTSDDDSHHRYISRGPSDW